jgi:hypothetical protein
MTDPVATVNFPPEWFGPNKWLHSELVQTLTYKDAPGETFFIAGGVLTDGTNVIGLCWSSGGQHIARCGPPLWAVEERIQPEAPAYTRKLWAGIVEALAEGRRDAEAELGRPPR